MKITELVFDEKYKKNPYQCQYQQQFFRNKVIIFRSMQVRFQCPESGILFYDGSLIHKCLPEDICVSIWHRGNLKIPLHEQFYPKKYYKFDIRVYYK
jgi:hypothetical protein